MVCVRYLRLCTLPAQAFPTFNRKNWRSCIVCTALKSSAKSSPKSMPCIPGGFVRQRWSRVGRRGWRPLKAGTDLRPAQETLKMLYESVKEGKMLATIWWRLPGSRGPRYFRTKLFFTSIANHFRNNLRSETYISYIFYTGYHQKGDFCLCVKNVMHVLDAFFLHIKSWCGKTLHILYKVSVVIFGQARFALRITLKC